MTEPAAGAAVAERPRRTGAAAAGRGGGAAAAASKRSPAVPSAATPRQKAMTAKRDAMVRKQVVNALSLQDIVDYETYIQGLVKTMESDKAQLERSLKMAEAKIRLARDPRRAHALNNEFEKMRRRGQVFNEDVIAITSEVERFHASAAFEQARDHVRENFDRVGDGWVKKTDRFGPDDEVDFELLLQQMKAEEPRR